MFLERPPYQCRACHQHFWPKFSVPVLSLSIALCLSGAFVAKALRTQSVPLIVALISAGGAAGLFAAWQVPLEPATRRTYLTRWQSILALLVILMVNLAGLYAVNWWQASHRPNGGG